MAVRLSRVLLLQNQRNFSSATVSLAFNRYGSANDKNTSPLVIGHGLFGHKQNWNSIAKSLQQRLKNQIFVIDFRNHGDSPHTDSHTYPELGADLAAFIEKVVIPETGAKGVHLLGHSMGGKAAAFVALDPGTQSLLEKLVIVDIAPFRANTDSLFPRFVDAMKHIDLKKSRREIDTDLAKDIPDEQVRNFLLTNLKQDPYNKDEFKWQLNLRVLGTCLGHLHSFAVVPGTFNKPTLFVNGEKSQYFTQEDLPVASTYFMKAQFKSIPDAGHWVHAEKPNEFIEAVTDFILKQ
ncbi:Protein R05D7.4 [Aphelenchoides avenae]|nr:Protein R05D7.4 [Aphelenchus avenae]